MNLAEKMYKLQSLSFEDPRSIFYPKINYACNEYTIFRSGMYRIALYDNQGRSVKMATYKRGYTQPADYTYTYRYDGNKTICHSCILHSDGVTTDDYVINKEFDKWGNMIKYGNMEFTYEYDGDKLIKDDYFQYSYDSNDRLIGISGISRNVEFEYDNNGNPIKVTNHDLNYHQTSVNKISYIKPQCIGEEYKINRITYECKRFDNVVSYSTIDCIYGTQDEICQIDMKKNDMLVESTYFTYDEDGKLISTNWIKYGEPESGRLVIDSYSSVYIPTNAEENKNETR